MRQVIDAVPYGHDNAVTRVELSRRIREENKRKISGSVSLRAAIRTVDGAELETSSYIVIR